MTARTVVLRAIAVVILGSLHSSIFGQVSSFPYTQNFDTVAAPALPPGWTSTQNRSAGTNDFTTTTSTSLSFPNSVLSTNATISQTLFSLLFDFTGKTPDKISFYTRRSTTHLAKVVVEASIDSGVTYPLVIGDTLTNSGTTNYVLSSFNLPPLLSTSTKTRFRWRVLADGTGTTGTFRIDDVTISAIRVHDLSLTKIRSSPAFPAEGDTVRIFANVRNIGQQSAESFQVHFFIDANNDSIPQPNELIASIANLTSLGVSDSVEIASAIGVFPPTEKLIICKIIYPPDQNPVNDLRLFPLIVGYKPRSIVVNEIMYAPTGPEPEWVELFNVRTDSVNLRNWLISDNIVTSKKIITTSNIFIPSSGYVLLTKDSVGLTDVHPGITARIITVSSFPALNNTGDAVVIYDGRTATMDSVSYLPNWGGSSGTSLERIDHLAPSRDSSNWSSSQDSAKSTPGRKNSIGRLDYDLRLVRVYVRSVGSDGSLSISTVVSNIGRIASQGFRLHIFRDANKDSVGQAEELIYTAEVVQPLAPQDSITVSYEWTSPPSGLSAMIALIDYPPDQRTSNNKLVFLNRVGYSKRSLVINEIMFAPFTGKAEYVELTNVSTQDVDVYQWQISDRPGSTGKPNTYTLGTVSRTVKPGEYFVLASDSSILGQFPSLQLVEWRLLRIANQSSLSLNNEGDEVVLKDLAGIVIDSVCYLPAWHSPQVYDKSGRSIEKINPLLGSNDARNWSTSVSGVGGTPGAKNSIHAMLLPSQSRIQSSPNPFSPDGDGYEDFTIIRYELPLAVSMIRLRIFDALGRSVKTLANNEPAGITGELVWDGRDEERQRCPMGIYVLFLEAIDDRGGILETAKGVVVVATQLK